MRCALREQVRETLGEESHRHTINQVIETAPGMGPMRQKRANADASATFAACGLYSSRSDEAGYRFRLIVLQGADN
jgi:hypothetical protein